MDSGAFSHLLGIYWYTDIPGGYTDPGRWTWNPIEIRNIIWNLNHHFQVPMFSSSRVFLAFKKKKNRVSFARVSKPSTPDALSFPQLNFWVPTPSATSLGAWMDKLAHGRGFFFKSPAKKKHGFVKRNVSFFTGKKKSWSCCVQKKTLWKYFVVGWFGWNLIKNFRSFVISGVLLRFPLSSLAGAVGNLLKHNTQTPRRKLFFAAVSCDLWDLFGKFRCLQGKGSSFWNLKMDFLLFDWSRSHHHQEQHFNCYDFATPKLQVICLPSWH